MLTGSTATGLSDSTPSSTGTIDRPIRGSCETVITPIDGPDAGICSLFDSAPSVFIRITGQCQLSHLGHVSLSATQQVLFQIDRQGQPVFSGLRNCAVLTAANGDQLRHTTTGSVSPGSEPGTVHFEGTLTFTGGSGRFGAASGAAGFSGSASLVTNTGAFSIEGRVDY